MQSGIEPSSEPPTPPQERRASRWSVVLVVLLVAIPAFLLILTRVYLHAIIWDGGVTGYLRDLLWIVPVALVSTWLWDKLFGG